MKKKKVGTVLKIRSGAVPGGPSFKKDRSGLVPDGPSFKKTRSGAVTGGPPRSTGTGDRDRLTCAFFVLGNGKNKKAPTHERIDEG